METRMNIGQVDANAYKAIMGLDKYVQSTSINKLHWELIKIRASQINGCSFCIDKHTKDARKLGETEQRLYLLSIWKETDLFSEEERTILALTEEITLIGNGGVSNDTYQKAEYLFGPSQLTHIIMAIISINAWNRIGVTTRMKPQADALIKN